MNRFQALDSGPKLIFIRGVFLLFLFLSSCFPDPNREFGQVFGLIGFGNYSNQFFQISGRVTGLQGSGLRLRNFNGRLINNRITGGESSSAGALLIAIESIASSNLDLFQNSIRSGRGTQNQQAVRLDSSSSQWSIQNNQIVANSNPNSVCLNIDSGSYSGRPTRNNNFSGCPGGQIRLLTQSFSLVPCFGQPVDGDMAAYSDPGCLAPLSTLIGAPVQGNISVNPSFISANPNGTQPTMEWNLGIRSDGTAPCVLTLGGRDLNLDAPPLPALEAQIASIDYFGLPRTNFDFTGLSGFPTGAAGFSLGAFEYDGGCVPP
jgi:hypothetical protein